MAQEHPASVFSGGPPDIIGVYTTEPTFVIDIGLILPTCVLGGVLLLKNRPMGYILLPVMLCLLVVVAAVVVGQTALQLRYGVVISLREVIGYVVTFVVFGLAAAVVNTRFLLKWWPNAKRARE